MISSIYNKLFYYNSLIRAFHISVSRWFFIFYSFQSFYTNVSWWYFTWIWVTASLLKSPGLFSVFRLIFVRLSSGRSSFILRFLSLPVPSHILWESIQEDQLQLGSLFPNFFSSLARSTYLSVFSYFNFTLRSAGTTKSTIQQVLHFLLIITRYGCLGEIWWSVCISKSQRSLALLNQLTHFLYTISLSLFTLTVVKR